MVSINPRLAQSPRLSFPTSTGSSNNSQEPTAPQAPATQQPSLSEASLVSVNTDSLLAFRGVQVIPSAPSLERDIHIPDGDVRGFGEAVLNLTPEDTIYYNNMCYELVRKDDGTYGLVEFPDYSKPGNVGCELPNTK